MIPAKNDPTPTPTPNALITASTSDARQPTSLEQSQIVARDASTMRVEIRSQSYKSLWAKLVALGAGAVRDKSQCALSKGMRIVLQYCQT